MLIWQYLKYIYNIHGERKRVELLELGQHCPLSLSLITLEHDLDLMLENGGRVLFFFLPGRKVNIEYDDEDNGGRTEE